jgi:gliding motility-associated-like protein
VSGSGSTYTATATMNSSVASGTLTYSINYSDLSGNAGTQVTTTTNSSVVTFDQTVPTLSAVTISSNNATSSLAKVGDVVTLSITSSESIQAPTVSIGGIAATVSGSGSTYTATATMTSSVTSGTITYSINYSDLSGNAGTQVTSTTNNSTVTFDQTVPTLSAVTISSNNATSSLAKVGDVVTLSITSSESIQAPTVSIGGIAATVSGSGSTYTATATMNSSVASGTLTYSINYSDLSGNAGTQVTTTTNSSVVTFDQTVPTLSAVTISSNNATSSLAKVGDVVTLSITASETIQTPTVSIGGITATMTGSGSTYTATATMSSSVASGTLTFTVNYSDLSGNAGIQVTSTTNSSTVTFDKTTPVISQINLSWGSVLNISEASTSGTISLTTTGVENGQIATIKLNSSTYTNTVTNNTASVTIPQSALTALSNGSTYSVTANVSDAAGNAATQVSASFIVDKENPSGYSVSWVPTIINNQNYRAVSFVLTNAEVGSTFTYTISGGTASISGNLTVTSTNQSIGSIDTYTIPDGVVNLGVVVKDAAGNIGNLVIASINKATNGAPTGVVLPITISQNDSNRVINLVEGLIDPDNDPITVNSVQISYSLVNISNNQSLPISTSRQALFSDIVSTSDLNGNNLSIETIKSKFLPANQKGVISISYIVTDGFNSVSQSTQLEIIGANDQPTGNNVSINQVSVNGSNALVPLIEGLGVSSSVPGVDLDDDLVSYVLDPTSAVANGQFQFQTDGSFVFVPDNDYFGEQSFNYFVKDQTGILQGPYLVKIVIRENPDIDGVPSVLEMLGTDGGDVNGDGVPDRKQNNITTFPITSYADFQAGLDWANDTTKVKPSASNIGSLLIGFIPNGTGSLKDTSLKLDPFAKFSNVSLMQKPTNVDSTTKFNSDVYSFQIEPMFGRQLTDLDGDSTNGKQTRVILNFPRGVKATTYLKKNTSGKWFSFLDDQNLSTWDEGATLVNLDNDTSTIERIILTIKDGGIGDYDGIVNDTIVDPGALGFIAPVIEDAILAPKREGLAAGTVLYNINEMSTGADTDLEGQALSYKIAAGTDAAILAAVRVDSITGQLQVKNVDAFDFETFEQNGIAKFSLYVTAKDISGFTSTAKFIVQILNVDEFPRIINDTSFYYYENQPVSVPVTKISALPDYQDVTTYSILPGYNAADFSINNSTGVLSFKNSPNYEANKKYQLDIQAIDMRGNTYHNLYSIYILDVNEAPFELKLAGDSLYENASKDTLFGKFTSLDIDVVDTAIYSLTSGVGDVDNDKFIVTPTGLLKANNVFDFEIKSTYSIRVSVTDKGGLTFDKVFAIRILDVDEDTDGDGVLDSKELLDGTSPTNFCSFKLPSVSLKPSTNWLKADCDNDGLTNEFEKSIGSNLQLIDTDGDGVNDGKEVADKTDPLNGCSLIVSSQDQSPSDNWKKADCDNDGLSNGVELGLKTNLLQPDTDLDGVIDGTEVADNTLPLDACSLVLLHQTLQPSLTWMNGDCNNDGILNSEVLLVKKHATTAVLQPDGTFKFKYTIFVRNTRPETLTGLVITEDLAKVFGSNMSFVVEAVTVSGNLQRNLGYDGQGSVNVTTSLSTVAGYASDSIQLFVKLQPKGYEGYVSNIASVDAVGKWGKVYRESIDTTVSGGRVTGNGLAAKVWIPKINLIIAGGFSPNNDGVDDKFIILRPWGTTVSLRIFNRWGQIVYQNPNYQNEWDGRGVGNMLGKLLPSGTYFYSVDSFDTSGKHQHFSGNVTMVR